MNTGPGPSTSKPIRSMLLLGGTGMLGRAFRERLEDRAWDVRCAARDAMDLSDPRRVSSADLSACDVILNCAAYTDVDGAESDADRADRVNGWGVGALAEACARSDAMLVHFSTDYVFNGSATEPYRTHEHPDPVNTYGRSKALGERMIRESGCRHLLIRTSWLYAPWGRNFVRTMVELMGERRELRVVNDQRGRPTSCLHLASATLSLLDRGAAGTLHVTDGGACTWYELAERIAERIDWRGSLIPCSTARFPRPAPRPGYSVLDLSATEGLLGPMPHWRKNLDDTLDRLE